MTESFSMQSIIFSLESGLDFDKVFMEMKPYFFTTFFFNICLMFDRILFSDSKLMLF
jgi:hypothetical protein